MKEAIVEGLLFIRGDIGVSKEELLTVINEEELEEVIIEYNPEKIVIGMPYNENGTSYFKKIW